jgi:DNA-binding PadR family transcriptional regulator
MWRFLVSGYNVVKKMILETVEDLGEVTAYELAEILERSYESVAMALMRYHRQGLLSRDTEEGRRKVYKITDRGIERLEYLQDQEKDKS